MWKVPTHLSPVHCYHFLYAICNRYLQTAENFSVMSYHTEIFYNSSFKNWQLEYDALFFLFFSSLLKFSSHDTDYDKII